MHMKFRLAGWLAVGGLLAAALIAPASVAATDLHAAHQGTSWDAEGFQSNDCETTPGPGQAVWHFVLTTPNQDSGHLTATFHKAGVQDGREPRQAVDDPPLRDLTGHDTLLDAETTDVDGGNLNLSHICVGTDRESQSAPVETPSIRSRPSPPKRSPGPRPPSAARRDASRPRRDQPAETEPVETATARSRRPRSRRDGHRAR